MPLSVRSTPPEEVTDLWAVLLACGDELPLPQIENISLAAEPAFEDEFTGCMAFPAPENL